MGGVFVWGDLARLPNVVAYTMVYALIILGIYLCASVDVVAMFMHRKTFTDSSSTGRAADALRASLADSGSMRTPRVAEFLRGFLKAGCEEHLVDQTEVVELCAMLAQTL